MPIGKYIYCTGHRRVPVWGVGDRSQMPIGKYIYCTLPRSERGFLGWVTNAYRQVHLLYLGGKPSRGSPCVTNAYRQVHLLYEWQVTIRTPPRASQMPIGKYIYCTQGHRVLVSPVGNVTNAYRQVHLLYIKNAQGRRCRGLRHKCLSASTFTVPVWSPF